VRIELGDEVEGTVELLYGGSVAKHTYVDGLSDIDALVLLPEDVAANESPAAMRKLFLERLRARFGRDAVREGTLAVTLTVDGKEIQLLPAIRQGEVFKIPSKDGTRWSAARPRKFAEALTAANQSLDGKLVPTIKLVKGIMSLLPEQRQLSGYHTEALAIETFQGYQGERTPKAMLRHFFEQASARVREPMRDTTGQSIYLDEYLGEADDTRRQVVSDALDRLARKIKNADGAQSLSMWREVLGV
jgi:hypothetical protein